MKPGNPIPYIEEAIYHAVYVGLSGWEENKYEFFNEDGIRGKKVVGKEMRRPSSYNITVDVFTQRWASTAMGFEGMGGASITDAYTIAVFGPRKDVCVYFGGRFAYHIKKPNAGFFLDLQNHDMAKVKDSGKYESE